MPPPVIEIVAVTWRQPGPLKVLVQCILNQTAPNWRLSVWHDGPDEDFAALMRPFAEDADGRIRFACTEVRHRDYGHSLRARGLAEASGDYLLLTNGDNYYVPRFVELATEAAADRPDVILFDMVHSHERPGGRPLPAYSHFPTEFRRNRADIGCAVVRRDIAQAVGFRDRRYTADATYFEDIAALRGDALTVAKLPRVLFVHN